METMLEHLRDGHEEATRRDPTVEELVLSDIAPPANREPRTDRDIAFIDTNERVTKIAHRVRDELHDARPLGTDADDIEHHKDTVGAVFCKLPNISTSSAHSPCRETHHA